MKRYIRMVATVLSVMLVLLVSPITIAAQEDSYTLVLDGGSAELDGMTVPEYDYVWNADPSQAFGQVKDSPAEYFTGTEPSGDDTVYIAHDIYYYPQLDESKFTQVNYDGETEWVYMYEAEGYENFIFSTLPVLRSGFPSFMMHSKEEAYQNPVLHITKPGTYRLQGSWKGQIRVDLGEDSFTDPEAKVTLILDNVDVECTVAPGIVFAQVYECDNEWEERESHSHHVDTSAAGANVLLADGTENYVSGTNIYRILRTKYKDEDSGDAYPAQKKQLKVDGAFYSYMSMNISGEGDGTGILTINSEFEGLDSELHLTVNGGDIRIFSDNDGINVNEDGVSVLTVSGGSLSILAGLGDEGDGIDSNGYVLITGGTVFSSANPAADSGLDSDCGTYVNGGTVVAMGSAMDWAEDAGYDQPVMNLRFSASRRAEEIIEVTDLDGNVLFSGAPGFEGRTYTAMILSSPELVPGESYLLKIGGAVQCWSDTELGGFGMPGQRPDDMQRDHGQRPDGQGTEPDQMPEGMEPGQMPEGMEPGQMPEGMEPGQMPEGMEPGQMPEGMEPGQMPEGMEPGQEPEGMQPGQPPEGMEPGQTPENWTGRGDRGGMTGATCTYERSFTLSEGVNAFSSVSDLRHDIAPQEDGEKYLCSACGAVFADAEGMVLLEAAAPSGNMGLWITLVCAVVLILAAVIAAGIIIRRKRKA